MFSTFPLLSLTIGLRLRDRESRHVFLLSLSSNDARGDPTRSDCDRTGDRRCEDILAYIIYILLLNSNPNAFVYLNKYIYISNIYIHINIIMISYSDIRSYKILVVVS